MGGPLVRALYRALLRASAEIAKHGLPLSGVHAPPGSPLASASSLAVAGVGLPLGLYRSVLADIFRSVKPGVDSDTAVDDGFTALRTLRQQLKVLLRSDEEARSAQQYWAANLQHTRRRWMALDRDDVWGQFCLVSGMVESAALHLNVLTEPHSSFLDGLDDEEEAGHEERDAKARRELDAIASEVRSLSPGAFAPVGGTEGVRGAQAAGCSQEQVELLSDVLYSRLKFRNPPVEWLYDGLAPLHLSDALSRRSGIPLTLAIMQQAVARRLGMVAHLCQATKFASASSSATDMRGATNMAPDPDAWLLIFPSADGSFLITEPGRKGRVLTEVECRAAFPEARLLSGAGMADLVQVWAALARGVMVAHMRRGESDAVASWLYQVLALDPQAPEWEAVLLPQDLGMAERSDDSRL